MIVEIDLAIILKVLVVLYFCGMFTFLGYMIGKSKGYDQGSAVIKKIYGLDKK